MVERGPSINDVRSWGWGGAEEAKCGCQSGGEGGGRILDHILPNFYPGPKSSLFRSEYLTGPFSDYLFGLGLTLSQSLRY